MTIPPTDYTELERLLKSLPWRESVTGCILGYGDEGLYITRRYGWAIPELRPEVIAAINSLPSLLSERKALVEEVERLRGDSSSRSQPSSVPQEARPERKALAALRRRATGGKSFMACRHPDIDEETPRSLSDPLRLCVLDQGTPEACEMTSVKTRADVRVHDKLRCPYWRRLTKAEPTGASPEETLMLLDALGGVHEGKLRAEPSSPDPLPRMTKALEEIRDLKPENQTGYQISGRYHTAVRKIAIAALGEPE